MRKHARFSVIAMSVFATGFLLIGCSSEDKEASAPAKAASITTTVPMSPKAATAPAVYVPEPAAAVITTCNIEEFDKESFKSTPIEAALSTTHSVSGWIAAPQLHASSFQLRLDDKVQGHYFQVQVTPAVKRPDVAASISKTPLPEDSGFMLELPVNAVPAGLYHLYLVAQISDKASVCDNGRQVDFK